MTRRRKQAIVRVALACAATLAIALALPKPAVAHLVQTGFGEFYDGIGHLFLTLPDLFVAIALALLAGGSGALSARRAIVALPSVWLVAAIAGRYAQSDWVSPWATSALFGVFGVLVAADFKLSPVVAVLASTLAGVLHGWSNGAGIGEALTGGGMLALFGIASSVFVVATITAALVVPLRSYAARIAIRVAGSWLAAVAILMLGWLARSRAAL